MPSSKLRRDRLGFSFLAVFAAVIVCTLVVSGVRFAATDALADADVRLEQAHARQVDLTLEPGRERAHAGDGIHAHLRVGASVRDGPHERRAARAQRDAKLLDLRQVQRLEQVRLNRLAFEFVPTSRSRTPRPLPR